MARFKIPPFNPFLHKPKGKGKKLKSSKIKTRATVKPIDVFKATFYSDAGANSQSNARKTLEAYIHSLSKAELSRLENEIKNIRHQVLEPEEEHHLHSLACDETSSIIAERYRRSTMKEASLCNKIEKKLESMTVSHIERSDSGNLRALWMDDKKFTTNRFILKFFSKELDQTRKLLSEGILITPHRGHGARAFIKHCISNYYE